LSVVGCVIILAQRIKEFIAAGPSSVVGRARQLGVGEYVGVNLHGKEKVETVKNEGRERKMYACPPNVRGLCLTDSTFRRKACIHLERWVTGEDSKE
jgi:hypothetical protein